ncbi:metallophosphoesterase [Erysipelothrix urinaevulpis]|uniref:metallophosphoesterase n=1 Tax=Erysipelothrix urinaevulpis TaxID=2683717 RepID=UPI001359EADE|nr:metallophosphoesterase [Erysipelothrix urinaevulpis]
MKRKHRQVLILSLVFLLLLGVFLDMKVFAIKRHKTRFETITHPTIPPSFDGVTIAYFSDVLSNTELLDKSISSINRSKPDIILFGGNLFLNKPNEKERKEMVKKLDALKAPLGKYMVLGDLDHKFETYALLDQAGFRQLSNNSNKLYNFNNEFIQLTAVDEKQTQYVANPESFEIFVMHDGKLADSLDKTDYNLLLAGKYLGGLFKPPFIDPLADHGKYYKKRYDLNDKTIINSQGLGTRDIELRFNTNPETIIILLESSPSNES